MILTDIFVKKIMLIHELSLLLVSSYSNKYHLLPPSRQHHMFINQNFLVSRL